jgi:hypothetical protein
MKKILNSSIYYIIFICVLNNFLLAQDPVKKKAPVKFKERIRIKTKAQLAKEEKIKDSLSFAKDVLTKIFVDDEVEVSPSFAAGDAAYLQFVQKNLNVNVPVNNEASVGKYQVLVKFIVMRDGNISHVIATTNFGYGMEKEAERVVKLSNKLWKAAMLRDTEVSCEKNVTLGFLIQE